MPAATLLLDNTAEQRPCPAWRLKQSHFRPLQAAAEGKIYKFIGNCRRSE
jgi:hypothetical protein